MTFELPLTEEKVKPHQITALHLISALSFIGTGAIFYWLVKPIKMWGACLLVTGFIILLITLFKNKWLVIPGRNRIFRIVELIILLTLALFVSYHHWWIASWMFGVLSATFLFAVYWENSGKDGLVVRVDTKGIKLPATSRKRFIHWTEVDKVLLRYGTLTIDCINNRLFQWSISNNNFDKDAFEHFCNNQVEVNKSMRRNDDW